MLRLCNVPFQKSFPVDKINLIFGENLHNHQFSIHLCHCVDKYFKKNKLEVKKLISDFVFGKMDVIALFYQKHLLCQGFGFNLAKSIKLAIFCNSLF